MLQRCRVLQNVINQMVANMQKSLLLYQGKMVIALFFVLTCTGSSPFRLQLSMRMPGANHGLSSMAKSTRLISPMPAELNTM